MASYRIIDENLNIEDDYYNKSEDEVDDESWEENENEKNSRNFHRSVSTVQAYFKCRRFIQITKRERTCQRLNSDLLTYVEAGDFVSFNNCLNEGGDINATCTRIGFNTCHVAALFDRCDLLCELLKKGANDFIPSWHFGYLPIHLAAWKGCPLCLRLLADRHPQSLSEQTTGEIIEPDINVLMLDSWVHEHDDLACKIPKITPGSTPLHIACKQLNVECVQYLLSKNPDLEIVDSRNMAALDVANENIAKVRMEKLRKCDFFQPYRAPSKLTLISVDAIESHRSSAVSVNTDETDHFSKILKIISLLLDAGAKFNVCEENVKNCTTILHTAIITQNEALLKILLKREDIDLTVRNELGDTPLHLAIRNKAKRCLILLLSWDEKRTTFEMKDYDGFTPLQIAINTGWSYGVSILMESSVSLDIVTNDGDTVLHLAARIQNLCVMGQLLSSEELVQVIDTKNNMEETPLMVSVITGNLLCFKKLIQFGADIRITARNNRTVAHAAAEKGHLDMLQLILHLDEMLVNAKTDDGETALHFAALEGHLKCVQLLLRKGCDITCKTMKVQHDKKYYRSVTSVAENYDFSGTPLHCAAWKGHIDVVKYLIEKDNSLIDERNLNGWYPLHIAAYFNHVECVEYIIKKGGNLFRKVSYFDGCCKNTLNIITFSCPDSISFFQNVFDSYIFTNNLPLNHPECLVTFNFGVLMPCGEDSKQMKVLNALLNAEEDKLQTTLLLHPLTETFLHLKWKKLSKFFVVITMLHAIFTLSLTSFALLVRYEHMENWQAVPVFIMLVCLVLLSLQEILHASKLQKYYFNDLEAWIKWSTYITSFAVSIGCINSMFNENADPRWKNVLAIPVLLSWIEILFLLSRFPVWGFYVLMFFRVTSNVIKVFCTFASLILGFVFSFYILFKSDETEFYSIWETFVKVVAMMSEFNYSETFKPPPEMNSAEVPIYEIVSRLVFLLFVVLIAIVLMNLMIGLAVSDITILEAQGKSQRLAKQIDFLHLLETFVYNETILKWLPERVCNHVRKNRKVSEEFTFSPGKPFGSQFHKLPCELRKTIMNYLLLKKNTPVAQHNTCKQEKKFQKAKTICDKLLAISEELDAIKRDYMERKF